MTRILLTAFLGVSLLGLPTLTGCDKTVEEKKSVETKPDGTKVESEKKVEQKPGGGSETTVKEEVKKP